MATQEQLDLRKQWLEALRSGKYKQGQSYLRTGDCYCCLGVLCDIMGIPAVETEDKTGININGERRTINPWNNSLEYTDHLNIFKYGGSTLGLSTQTANVIGLRSDLGAFELYPDGEPYRSLADMNDEGSTFEEIADFIDSNYDIVFKD